MSLKKIGIWMASIFATTKSSFTKPIITCLALTINAANADVSGDYVFTVAGTSATITDYIGYGGAVDIPSTLNGSTVRSIGASAFEACTFYTNITSITIPEGVTNVGDHAFASLPNFTSVSLPNSLITIGPSAFWNCPRLPSISVPNNVLSIGNGAFTGCSRLSSVTLGNSITNIGNQAFYWCYSLTTITIPESVVSMGNTMFYLCTNLTSVTLPSTLKYLPSSTFYFCYKLPSITIPANVTNIGQSAFSSCYNLSSVNIPSGVAAINGYVFQNCRSLNNISLPTSITNIMDYAFAGCWGLSSIDIPTSIKVIGQDAFGGCSGLTSVSIPPGIKSINKETFMSCTALTNVSISGTVTNINDYAFDGCKNIVQLTLSNGIQSIGVNTFRSCFSLTQVLFPQSIKTLNGGAFQSCTNVTGFYFMTNAPTVYSGAISSDTKSTVYYLAGTTGWGTTLDGRPTALWSGPSYSLSVINGTGGGSYTNASSITITANPPSPGQEFDRWTGSTQYVASVTSAVTMVIMPSSDSSVTASYRAMPILAISSAFGLPTPSVGSYTNNTGTAFMCSVNSPISSGTTQYQCKGWTGTGSLPAVGTTTNTGSFTLTTNSTLIWKWQTNFWLHISNCGNGSVGTNDLWLIAGTNIQVTAYPLQYYLFANWGGQTNGCSLNGSNITIGMVSPRQVTATFVDDASTNNVPKAWLAQFGLTNFNNDAMSDGNHNGMAVWEEWLAGCNPTNPNSVFACKQLSMTDSRGIAFSWASISNRFYDIAKSTNLSLGKASFMILQSASNMPATPPTNVFTNGIPDGGPCFYRIQVHQ